jgi:hypothetical protein
MSRFARRRSIFVLVLFAAHQASSGGSDLPGPQRPDGRAASAEEAEIEGQPICIGSTVRSAGVLGPALLYRRSHLPDGRLAIGYYVFFSDERPWGNNWLTWLLVPALAIDLVYTRALFMVPGIQRAAYGKGDVEGFQVVYDVDNAGRLTPVEAFADDGTHRPAHLDRRDLFSVDPARLTVSTDVWSHQLGARRVRAQDLAYRRCYGPGAIRPLTEAVVRDFRLDRRALPAALGPLYAALSPDRGLVDGEDDHRAQDGHEKASGGLVRRVEPERPPQETAYQRARDTEQGGDDEAARLTPWRQQLGHDPDDQTKQDPQQDRHIVLLSGDAPGGREVPLVRLDGAGDVPDR